MTKTPPEDEAQQPSTPTPKYAPPVYAPPVTEEAATEQLAAEAPAAAQPVAEQPAAEQPEVAQQPAAEQYEAPQQPSYQQPSYAPPAEQQPAFQPPAAQQPGYPQQPGYQQPAYLGQQQMPFSKPPTNVFAIVGLIGVFFLGLAGIIFGHIALSQIKRTGESGRGLALAATIIGYVRVGFTVIALIASLAMAGLIAGAASGTSYSSSADSTDSNDYSSGLSQPWKGTDKEPFCDALTNYDLQIEDLKAFYTELKEVNTDAEFDKLIDAQLEAMDFDYAKATPEELDRLNKDLDAFYEMDTKKYTECLGL